MPIREADPWRLQYFEQVPCPADVEIPTEDCDAWMWNPQHRWVYDKIAIALSQGLPAGPHGVTPPSFPVFSKPIVNLRGMGVGSRMLHDEAEYRRHCAPGHMWMPLLGGGSMLAPMLLWRMVSRFGGVTLPACHREREPLISGPCMPRPIPRSRRAAAPGQAAHHKLSTFFPG